MPIVGDNITVMSTPELPLYIPSTHVTLSSLITQLSV